MLAHPADAARFDHRSIRSQIAEQDGQATGGRVSVVAATDDFVILDLSIADILAQSLTGDGGAIQVQRMAVLANLFEDRRDATEAGFQIHISKPVEPAVFVTMVASLTERI